LEFQFFWLMECLTHPHVFFFRGYKHQHSFSIIIMLKKFLSASAITIISWQDVTLSSLCSCVKECGTKRAQNFLFPKS
jgi:hypothetical protein